MRKARPFHPPANRESYKDLLIFEERLKQNAERLQKQRCKYEAFLISLVAVIAYLGYIVFVRPSIYSLVHYGNVALLLVALTTLILFFATGMYSEKIAYAHKFVPQANRALRPFNIYLNTRHRSRFSLPFSLFGWSAAAPSSPSATLSRTPSTRSLPDHSSPPLSRQASSSSISSTTSLRSAGALRSPPVSRSSSPTPAPSSSSRTASPAPSPPPPPTSDDGAVTRAPPSPPLPPPARGIPIPPIPPAQNPRGELIFSSRVAPQFREGYERYRAEWERRRAEARKLQTAAAAAVPGRGGAGWKAWLVRPWRSAGSGTGSTPSSGGSSVGGEKGDKALAMGASEQDRGGIVDRDSSVDSASASAAGDNEPRRRSRRSSAGVAAPSLSPSPSPSPSPTPADAWTPSHRPSLSAESITSSTSTPASSCCPSRSPSPARSPPPLDDEPPRPRPATASPGRIRAESFSELLELEASEIEGDRQRQNAPPPPLVRTGSRRRSS
ncbi:hypothetical protein JCM5296_004843 [Sporobolomyces johnsonii]